MVFRRYRVPNSSKGVTRAKRKRGKSKVIRRDVESEQRIGNWDRFIFVEANKATLTHFLSTEMSQHYETHPGRELVVSGGFRAGLFESRLILT